MNLLMFTGDRDVVQGREGPFSTTLAGLSKEWDRIDVITPYSATANVDNIHGNIFLHPASGGRHKQPFHIVSTTGDLLRERSYHLAVSHDFGLFYNGIGALWVRSRYGIPYVSELHHVSGHPRPANIRERVDKWIAKFYVHMVKGRVEGFRVVNSTQMPSLLSDWGVPAKKIMVIPSFYLDMQIFQPDLNVESTWDVMFCGRLVPNKGLDLLVQAFGVIAARFRQAKFLIVGEGPSKPYIEKELRRKGLHDRVTFAGWLKSQHELADCYRSSRLLLCASYNEGGPRVCLEAMACGTPVVSTAVGVMPDVIEDDKNGKICDWDGLEIGQKAIDILSSSSKHDRFAKLGPSSVAHFETSRTLKAYSAAYKDVAVSAIRNKSL